MKPIIILLLLSTCLIIPGNAEGQKSVKKLVREMKKHESYEGISLPGWVIRWGSRIAARHDDEWKESGLAGLVGKIRHLRVATAKMSAVTTPKGIRSHFVRAIKSDGFDEYVKLRDDDQHLNLFVREEDGVINSMVLLSDQDGEVSLIHLKTRWTEKDLEGIAFGRLSRQLKTKHRINTSNTH